MRVKLNDTQRTFKERVSFKEFIKQTPKPLGSYNVVLVFPPRKFPSYTLIFDAGEREVKLTIGRDKMKKIFEIIGATGVELPGLKIGIEEDGYYIETDNTTELMWTGSYWKREERPPF